MKLIHLHVENFGCLHALSLELHEGVNGFCMDNGSGKTTLCAFIKCMLYGLSQNRKQDISENERKHYLPWQGGECGGSLTVLHEGRTYRITRRFGKRPAEDLLEVYDEETGARTDALGSCPGEAMLSMDARGFSDAAVFSERAFSLTVGNESVLALMGAQTGQRETTLEAAIAQLAQERKQYERSGGRGLLFENEAALSRIAEKEAALAATAESFAKREAAFLFAKGALAALSTKADENGTPQAMAKSRRKGSMLSLILSLLLFAFSALGFFISPYLYFLLLPAAALLLATVFCKNEKKSVQNASCSSQICNEFEEKYHACAEAQKCYEEAAHAQSELLYLEKEKERLMQRRMQIEQRLADIKKTEELLFEAGRRYREKSGKAMLCHFREQLRALGERESERFLLDDRLSPSLLSGDAYRSAEALSSAGKDAVSLSRSLSLLRAMPKETKPPLLLDDPFLSFDDGRLCGALELLFALGEEYQVLYFTCSHSRMP